MQERGLTLGQFVRRDGCPACHGRDAKHLSNHHGFSRAEHFPGTLVRLEADVRNARRLLACTRCGLWFFNLVPRSDVLKDLLDAPSVGDRWAAADRPTFQRARAAIERFVARPGTLLDVGAHSGGFLDTVPSTWRKAAVEPMLASSATIAGVDVHAGFLEHIELEEGRYDCITAFDVVEHFADPALAFARIARALRPGGIFVLETGTTDALAARLFGPGWYYVNYLEHFQAFGTRSLQALLEQAGLQVRQADRVAPLHPGAAVSTVRAGASLAFGVLTAFGRSNRLWLGVNRVLRPGGVAMPPTTIGLERDHLFVVAAKPAADSA